MELEEQSATLIDTGGVFGEHVLAEALTGQTELAVNEADLVLLLLDGREGVTAADEDGVMYLRKANVKFLPVINKIDGLPEDQVALDFERFGFPEYVLISASHSRGLKQLREVLEQRLADLNLPQEPDDLSYGSGIRVAVVGRPNVGKSTLVNRLIGEDRQVVFDMPGTTKDAIDIPFTKDDVDYVLIDTAGVRRKGKVSEITEKFSVVKALDAMQRAHVVVLVIDASEGLVEQDLHVLEYALDAGAGMVIAVNKWDGMTVDDKAHVKHELQARLEFAKFARIHFISALHGSGVGDLYQSVEEAHDCAFTKWSTNKLTTLLEDAILDHQPPLVHGRRIKLRYAHLGGSNPPLFIVHGNQTNALPTTYKRYLENKFIKVLKIRGTPVRFEFRTSDNPFDGKKNQLSQRQITKKQRLVKHVNKAKKKAKKK